MRTWKKYEYQTGNDEPEFWNKHSLSDLLSLNYIQMQLIQFELNKPTHIMSKQ